MFPSFENSGPAKNRACMKRDVRVKEKTKHRQYSLAHCPLDDLWSVIPRMAMDTDASEHANEAGMKQLVWLNSRVNGMSYEPCLLRCAYFDEFSAVSRSADAHAKTLGADDGFCALWIHVRG